MREAGYPERFPDPTIPLVLTQIAGQPEIPLQTELVHQYLTAVGFQVTMREMDHASVGAMGRARKLYMLNPIRNAPPNGSRFPRLIKAAQWADLHGLLVCETGSNEVADRPLEGKVALITGAGSGIGAATAKLMAQQGASVAVTGIPAGGAKQVADEINAAGGRAVGIPADVSDSSQVKNAVDQAVAAFGRLDILVPNAGIQMHREDRNVHELDEAVWDRTHAVNYRGQFLTCKHGLAQMMKQGEGGVIVMVASVTALLGLSPNAAYSTGKAGLLGLNRNIAVEYAKHGIRCNAVCPGALERTPDHDRIPDPEGRARRAGARIPMGRMGQPDDIAPVIAFLAGPGARYMNGANVVVDGGLTVV